MWEKIPQKWKLDWFFLWISKKKLVVCTFDILFVLTNQHGHGKSSGKKWRLSHLNGYVATSKVSCVWIGSGSNYDHGKDQVWSWWAVRNKTTLFEMYSVVFINQDLDPSVCTNKNGFVWLIFFRICYTVNNLIGLVSRYLVSYLKHCLTIPAWSGWVESSWNHQPVVYGLILFASESLTYHIHQT